MKLRERTDDLDPRAERELEAIDRALAGEPVEPDLADWAELAELLRDERPEADQSWSAELDQAAADRFPHRRPESGGGSALPPVGIAARVSEWFPRRMTAPVAALATLAVVAVVAVTTLSPGGGSDDSVTSGFQSIEGGSAKTRSLDGGELSAGAAALSTPGAEQALDATGRSGREDEGAISPGTDNRKVDRDVTLALAAPPEDVNDVSDKAIFITRDLDGIVASSNVSTAGKDANATLDLVIPTRNLDMAIDRLTEIGDVKSLNEGSVDITRVYVTSQDRLDDAEAERRQLLEALGNASTDIEAEALRLQIADARKDISKAQAAFDSIQRRAQLSDLSLTIQGDRGASSKGDDDARTLGDWLDDTVSVLRDVAGVLLISGAILIPLGILITIAWLVVSRITRRRRDRALDD